LYNFAFGAGLKSGLKKRWAEINHGSTNYQKEMYRKLFEERGNMLGDVDEFLYAPMFGFKDD